MSDEETQSHRAWKVAKDKEWDYIKIKGLSLQDDVIILTVHAPNKCQNSWAKIDRIAKRNRWIHYIVGDFNTPISEMDRPNRRKIRKDIVELKNTINQLAIIDIYRLFHLTTAKYTFFSSSHGTFTKIDDIRGHNAYLTKFKRIEIIQCLLSGHNGIN